MTVRSITLFLLAGLLAAPVAATHNAPMSAAELADRLGDEGAPFILDVRSEQEYQSGHVPGAAHINYQQLSSRLTELSPARDEEIVVYCEVGGRADVANKILESAGYTRVRNLEGHMRNWRGEDYPQE